MTTSHHAPQRRAGPDRPAAHSRHRHDLRRAGRELPRRARRALRPAQLDPLRHLPPGRRRRQHGGGLRQADRQARHLLRHPRAGRHQRQHRLAYRLPGFDADDPAGRPGGARGQPTARRSRKSTIAACSARWPSGSSRSRTRGAFPSWSARHFTRALNGRPGPVVVALPEDMLTDEVEVADAGPYKIARGAPGAGRHGEAARAARRRRSGRW